MKSLNPTRRQLLRGIAAGSAIAASGIGLLHFSALYPGSSNDVSRGAAKPRPGVALRPSEVETAVLFLATLFARRLTENDITELADRIHYGCNRDAMFLSQTLALVHSLDRFARKNGLVSFRRAGGSDRTVLVHELLSHDPRELNSRAHARISGAFRERAVAVRVAAPRLARLYRKSGAPFRARGYARWPGVPGDWHEYLTVPAALA